jgi:hypothetical protein
MTWHPARDQPTTGPQQQQTSDPEKVEALRQCCIAALKRENQLAAELVRAKREIEQLKGKYELNHAGRHTRTRVDRRAKA